MRDKWVEIMRTANIGECVGVCCVSCVVSTLLLFTTFSFFSPSLVRRRMAKEAPKKDIRPSYKLHGDSPVYMGPVAFGKLVKGAIAGK
jgi:hypothetical protein